MHREAQQTITIITSIDGYGTSVSVVGVTGGYGSKKTKLVRIRPVDANGTPLGPGLAGYLIVNPEDGVVVESVVDYDHQGTYEIKVSFDTAGCKKPAVTVCLFGRMTKGVSVSVA